MKYFIVVVVALLACHGCLAKPKARPDAPAAPKKDTFDDMLENVQKIAENFGLTKANVNEAKDTINDNTNKLLTSLQSFIDKVKSEGAAHSGEVREVFNKVETKLSETAADLNKNLSPEVQAKADEMKAAFNKAFKNAADQINQFVKDPKVADAQNDIKKFSEDFLNQVTDLGKTAQKKIETMVEDHEKTHQH